MNPRIHNSGLEPATRNRDRAWSDVFLAFVAALILTAVSLSYSAQYGRLLFEIDYEDVITHVDGLERYRDLSEGGVGEYLRGYVESPPHAPLHSMLATLSFGLFGVNDWAPYLGNVLVAFGYFGAVLYFLPRSGSLVAKLLGLIFAAGFPVAFLSVHDFRPDYPAAVFTVWGVLLLVGWNPLKDPSHRCWLAGFAFAAALLWKPTVFPYTVAVGGVALAVAIVRSQIPRFGWSRTVLAIIKTWPFFAANVILALPHFVVAGPKLIEYMIRNQVGADKASWSLKGSFQENSLYHFLGYSGEFQLGQQKWLLLAVVVAAGIAFLANARVRVRLGVWHFGAGCVVTGIAFFGVAINHHDNPYFGLVFQILLVLLGSFVLVQCWGASLLLSKWLGVGARCFVLFAIFIPVVAGSPWPKFRHAAHLGDYEIVNYAKTVNRDLFEMLKPQLASADQGNVVVTTYGLVSNHTLQWLADKEAVPMNVTGLPNKPLEDLSWIINQREQHHQVVDFVIATEPGAYGVHDFLPSADTAGAMLDMLQSGSEYSFVGSQPVPGGNQVHVFQRRPNFGGWTAASGLSQRMPAVEERNIPVRQFGYWPAASLTIDSPDGGEMSFAVRWMPVVAGTGLAVLANGKEVFRSPQDADREFRSELLTLPVQVGENVVELRFSSAVPGELGKPAVTFTELRVTTVP